MKLRKRLKAKARKVKVESAFVDFDTGESIQIPMFVQRIHDPDFDAGKFLGVMATTALAYDMRRKGISGSDEVEINIATNPDGTTTLDWLKSQPGTLVDDHQ